MQLNIVTILRTLLHHKLFRTFLNFKLISSNFTTTHSTRVGFMATVETVRSTRSESCFILRQCVEVLGRTLQTLQQ